MQVTEIYNFNQDDLMTEDVFILDCHSSIFVWVGQQVDQKLKTQALVIGEVCGCTCIFAISFSAKSCLFIWPCVNKLANFTEIHKA